MFFAASLVGVVLMGVAGVANAASTLYAVDSSGSGGTLNTLDQGTGASTPVGPIGYDWPGDMTSDTRTGTPVLYAPDINTSQLLTINPTTGAGTAVGAFGSSTSVVSVAFDNVTGKLYGTTAQGFGATGDELYEINPATGAAVLIGALGVNNVYALAFDNTGVLYGVSQARGSLVTISTLTGAAAIVAPVTLTACFDIAARLEDGVMFAADSGTGSLYTMDLTTGATTLVGPYAAANVVGLAFIPEPATMSLLAIGAGLLARRRRRA
jgi:hypothetical protein